MDNGWLATRAVVDGIDDAVEAKNWAKARPASPSFHQRANHDIAVQEDRATVVSKGYAFNLLDRRLGDALREVWAKHELVRSDDGWRCSAIAVAVVVHARGNEPTSTRPDVVWREMPRAKVTARVRNLAVLELVNIGLIGWVVFGAFDAPSSPANLVGFGATTLLLAVGAAYWLVKLNQLRAGLGRPPMIGAFRALHLVCALALAAGMVTIAVGFGSSPGRFVPGLVLYLLAVAEYVNYFHWQLMYDNRADIARLLRTGRLSRAHLHTDLRKTG